MASLFDIIYMLSKFFLEIKTDFSGYFDLLRYRGVQAHSCNSSIDPPPITFKMFGIVNFYPLECLFQ